LAQLKLYIQAKGVKLPVTRKAEGKNSMTKIKAENLAQAEAFSRMHGDVPKLIQAYAADFRRIITAFESTHNGKAPSADELLWLESEYKGRDITQL